MRPIPLSFLTMYADLAQSLEFEDVVPGSITTRTIKGRSYLYVTSKDGATRRQRSLGPAEDPDVKAAARRIAEAEQRAKTKRTIVSTLKQQARIPAPTLPVGRVLESVANAGLFKRGVTLVGTVAYQTYPCIIGSYLPATAFTTNDIDLSVVAFEPGDKEQELGVVLKRANPTFEPQWHAADANLPRVFRSSDGLRVDILTRGARNDQPVVPVKGLGCSAVALSFQEFPAQDTMEAVVLYGTGVPVRVPSPIRFAVHKLIVAQRRSDAPKRQKDLRQAQELIDVLLEMDLERLQDCLDEARDRGKAWKTAINTSLKELGRDTGQGRPPLPNTPKATKSKR